MSTSKPFVSWDGALGAYSSSSFSNHGGQLVDGVGMIVNFQQLVSFFFFSFLFFMLRNIFGAEKSCEYLKLGKEI